MLFLPLVSILFLACQVKLDLDSQDGTPCWTDESAGPVDHTLDSEDSCQRWELGVGAHAYINVSVQSENTECQSNVAPPLSIPYEPTYSNLGSEGPKWTYDILGESEGEGAAVIECQDGTVWEGYFIVTETEQ